MSKRRVTTHNLALMGGTKVPYAADIADLQRRIKALQKEMRWFGTRLTELQADVNKLAERLEGLQ